MTNASIASIYVPLALGFFGLGVGYFVWGGQLLFNFPRATTTSAAMDRDRTGNSAASVPAGRAGADALQGVTTGPVATTGYAADSQRAATDRAMGLWGIWMPGFMQFLTGIMIWVGITWFHVFEPTAPHTPLYMAALAFTAFGVHWFVLGYRRYIQADVLPDGWMAIAFLLLSILGIIVFASAKDAGVTILFVGLALIYLTEVLVRFGVHGIPLGDRLIGVWQLLTGIWLMYLTYAVVLDHATTMNWPV